MKSIRLFAALSPGSEIQNQLKRALDRAALVPSGVRWVKPEHLHLALKFFGEMPEERMPLVTDLLAKAAARHGHFSLELTGFGGFPNARNPQVIFVTVRAGAGEAQALALDIEKASDVFGFPAEKKPFQAHVTLGRVRTRTGLAEVMEKLAAFGEESFGVFEAGSFWLYQSQLTGEGPVYTPLREFFLRV